MRSISVTVGLLFIALCHPSFAQKAAPAAEEEQAVRVTEGEPLTVECALRVEERAQWRRDGGALPADMRPAGEAPAVASRGGLAARLHAAAARAHHAGLYTCAPGSRAVRVLVLPALEAAGEPAAVPTPPTAPAPAPALHAGDTSTIDYKLFGTFNLSCGASTGSQKVTWKANDTALDAGPLKGRYKLENADMLLKVERAIEDDYGNYTCEIGDAVVARWELRAEPLLRQAKDTNVVEGQKLKLTCRVVGKPYPAVQWKYRADVTDDADNGTDVAVALGGRAVLAASAAGVPDGELVLEAAQRSDAGGYSCHYTTPSYNSSSETVVRVKDMYAALWPFLGICAEVFILCAIILVYEKRRPKRELDDSDTDNHEQKKS